MQKKMQTLSGVVPQNDKSPPEKYPLGCHHLRESVPTSGFMVLCISVPS